MRITASFALLCALVLALFSAPQAAQAQLFGGGKMKKANEMIGRQKRPEIFKENEALVTPDNARVVVSLSKQRAYLFGGDALYIDTPISSGKRLGMTPTGSFSVMEKDPNHKSS